MPYAMRKIRNANLYKVINTETGEIHSKGTTKTKAQSQLRILKEYESQERKKRSSKK